MRIWSIVLSTAMALSFGLAATSADAARLGGGKSTGKQSSNVTQRDSAKPATPAAPPTAAAPAVAPKKPWGAMLGGLAAGLGLAWLASSLGLGGAMGNIVMILLLAVQMVYVCMVYGPIAAFLVELFPTRIRYTSMSLPYHLGNGWFGGFLPLIAAWITVSTGNIYAGLWYPIGVAAMTALIGSTMIKETKDRHLMYDPDEDVPM